MFYNEDEGYNCSECNRWIQETGDWFCEECKLPTCDRCGRFDHVEDVFLCPDCVTNGKISES